MDSHELSNEFEHIEPNQQNTTTIDNTQNLTLFERAKLKLKINRNMTASPTTPISSPSVFDRFGELTQNISNTVASKIDMIKDAFAEPQRDPVMFGLPLDVVAFNFPGVDAPPVVKDCITYLMHHQSYLEEGIFRISGSHTQMQEIRELYDRGDSVDLEEVMDPHCVAGILKLFLRELPATPFTVSRLNEFNSIASL
eukprot:TRINITY_DN4952_c0_g1_i2.p1 TRINITY_DN4952_c0_g1~~TRINITY_DN4952_c0_g1_i2.p1  ORF type:complete len:197 (-),score=37.89 TRINITY_DN4952_c0_g1_i2:631-1221(-)